MSKVYAFEGGDPQEFGLLARDLELFLGVYLNEAAPRSAALRAVEQLFVVSGRSSWRDRQAEWNPTLEELLNEAFAEAGEPLTLEDGRVRELSQPEPHSDIARNVSDALGVDARFSRANERFQQARIDLAVQRNDSAITEAATALEEALVALGLQGKTLGELMKSARNQQLFSAEHTQLGGAMEALVRFVSSLRDQKSNTHHGPHASHDDAALVVHLAGVVCVWLHAQLSQGGRIPVPPHLHPH